MHGQPCRIQLHQTMNPHNGAWAWGEAVSIKLLQTNCDCWRNMQCEARLIVRRCVTWRYTRHALQQRSLTLARLFRLHLPLSIPAPFRRPPRRHRHRRRRRVGAAPVCPRGSVGIHEGPGRRLQDVPYDQEGDGAGDAGGRGHPAGPAARHGRHRARARCVAVGAGGNAGAVDGTAAGTPDMTSVPAPFPHLSGGSLNDTSITVVTSPVRQSRPARTLPASLDAPVLRP